VQAGDLDQELHQSAGHYPDGGAQDGLDAAAAEPAEERQRRQEGENVEYGRGHGRDEERAVGVEQAHGPGGQGDEQKKGEHDRRHLPGQGQLARDLVKAVGDEAGQRSGRQDADQDDQADHQEQDIEDVRGKAILGLRALLLLIGQDRNEGRGQGVLGEQVAEQVGDAEGGPEGVVGQPGSEEMVDDHLADQSQDPAEGRAQGEGAYAFGDVGHEGNLVRREYSTSGRGGLPPDWPSASNLIRWRGTFAWESTPWPSFSRSRSRKPAPG